MSEQNKIEELLKPRYKVIADYPFSTFKVGEILFDFDQFSMLSESDFIKHPHIFKKLEWWEDRQESELPKYLRFRTQYADKIIKVDRIANGSYGQPSNRCQYEKIVEKYFGLPEEVKETDVIKTDFGQLVSLVAMAVNSYSKEDVQVMSAKEFLKLYDPKGQEPVETYDRQPVEDIMESYARYVGSFSKEQGEVMNP